MSVRKNIPKKHWTILEINDAVWGYFNLRDNEDGLVNTVYSIYRISKMAIAKNRLLYIYSLPYDESMSIQINAED